MAPNDFDGVWDGNMLPRPRRSRKLLMALVLAGATAWIAPLEATAVTGDGYVYGPWSCPVDYHIGMTFNVTGTSPAYVGIEMSYTIAGVNGFYYTNIYPGWSTRFPPPGANNARARTINKFGYSTHGNANLVTWVKECDPN